MSSHRTRATIAANALTFTWPDGAPVIASATFAFDGGTTGLVGANGSGKSTLLRLLAGRLTPTSGTVHHSGHLAYLPQDVALAANADLAAVLGVAHVLRAVERIEEGDADESLYGIVGEDWDIDTRTMAALATVGLSHLAAPAGTHGPPTREPDLTVADRSGAAVDAARRMLHRRVGTVSGGEATALALAACLLERPDVLLLDEPTNNLDRSGRERVHDLVRTWRRGTLVVVSHDRELLEFVDQIADLRAGSLTLYGGGWSAYREAVDAERAAARAALRTAESAARREQRERREAETTLARRRGYAKATRAQARYPKIVANARRREAEVSAGKLRGVHEDREASARARVEAAQAAVRDDDPIRLELPATAVPAGRTVLELRSVILPLNVRPRTLVDIAGLSGPDPDMGGPGSVVGEFDSATGPAGAAPDDSRESPAAPGGPDSGGMSGRAHRTPSDSPPGSPSDSPSDLRAGIDLVIAGPERIALTGANGSGKTTMLNVIVGVLTPVAGTVRRGVPARMLPQRLDGLAGSASVFDNVRDAAPDASPQAIRAALARFGFGGGGVDRPASALCGGERFRATLATILLATPAPQLLILDEPTNSLDVSSVAQLVSALESYQGALIVASHDMAFLRECRLTRWLALDAPGALPRR
ncbi:MAG: ATP-binding cassette domain-containing protein [Bifidobacteriaceae bacterium]|jgi:ATPase subunit of ABC transporter with duplicated ATPase domains|nr:ATP-binding cassette domain-containing protein [Bifidobacteriaceae bacterium]